MDFEWKKYVIIVLMATLDFLSSSSNGQNFMKRSTNETSAVNGTNQDSIFLNKTIKDFSNQNYSLLTLTNQNASLPGLANQTASLSTILNQISENEANNTVLKKSELEKNLERNANSLANKSISEDITNRLQNDSTVNNGNILQNTSKELKNENSQTNQSQIAFSAVLNDIANISQSKTFKAEDNSSVNNSSNIGEFSAKVAPRSSLNSTNSETDKQDVTNGNAKNITGNQTTENPSANITYSLIPSSITFSKKIKVQNDSIFNDTENAATSLLGTIGNHSIAAIPSNITFSVIPTAQNTKGNSTAKNESETSNGNSLVSLTIPTNKVYAAVPSNITFSTIPQSIASDIAAIDIKSKTKTLEDDIAENITQSLNKTDCNTTTTASPPTTTSADTTTAVTTTTVETTTTANPKQVDDASHSEIYKMHNNGLMLLHAQSARFGSEAKKSELLDNSNSASINYHVRKRTNGTNSDKQDETDNTLASALAHIPGVLRKRSIQSSDFFIDGKNMLRRRKRRSLGIKPTVSIKHSKFFINPSPVPFIPELYSPCSALRKRNSGCQKSRKLKHYGSLVQGESYNGDKLKRRKTLPRKIRSLGDSQSPILTNDDVTYARTYSLVKIGSEKHKRLKRALRRMSLPTEYNDKEKSYRIRRDLSNFKESVQRSYIEKIPHIPNIPKLKDNIIEENSPFDGELKLEQFHRLPAPGMEAFESIDKIQPIENERGGGIESEFIHVTSPPSLKEISEIKDLPTISPLSFLPEKEGQHRPVPVKDTIKTKYGVVTRVTL